MDFETLRMLSRAMIPRDGAEELYAAEERAMQTIKAAALELAKRINAHQAVLEEGDAVALELASLLDRFGSAGATAARLIVERYGESEPDDDAAKSADQSGMPRPDPQKVLEFLSGLSPKTVYRVDAMCDQLTACGFSVEKIAKVTGITVNGIRIRRIVPDFGEPGIAASDLLNAAVHVFIGQRLQSKATGQGFRYDDILEQLRTRLEADSEIDPTE